MPHSHSPFPLGKGGKPYGKNVQMSKSFCLNMVQFYRTHSFLNLQAKFFNYVLWQNFQRIKQNSLNLPTNSVNYVKFAAFIYPLYLMFQIHAIAENCLKFQRIRQISLNSPTDAANYEKFTPIINPFILCFRGLPRQRMLRNFSELCKFRAIHPQLLQIMQNLHHLLTHYIVCFRCLTSGRELPKIPLNQAKFAQFAYRSRELCEFHAFRINIHPYLVD